MSGPDAWTDEYMAEAEALAKKTQGFRRTHFDEALRQKLLLADALLVSRAETSALRKALEEARLLVSEYDRDQSDWSFRLHVILGLIDTALTPASIAEKDDPAGYTQYTGYRP